MTYTATSFGVIRDSDGAFIPADDSNADYLAFKAWRDGGGRVNPDASLQSKAWLAHQLQAQQQLDKSDLTLLRCIENGVSIPSDWHVYRGLLRDVVRSTSGDASQPLPNRPAYPQGT